MKNLKSIKRPMLIFFCAAFVVLCMNTTKAKAQTVWMVCTWDTSSSYKQKDGREKFERRFYVTDLISVSKEVYLGMTEGHHVEDFCGDYIEATVYKAAIERGEKLDSSGTLKVIKNIEPTADGFDYKFAPKEEVERERAEAIKEAQKSDRQIITFNWDPTNNNVAADLAKEQKRIPANMAVTAAPPTANIQTTAASTPQAAGKSAPASNYIFVWARILTSGQDFSRSVTSNFKRAYYSNILALPTNADANALKGQVTAYFTQLGLPAALKDQERLQINDVMVKTFPTVYEADNARYAMATQDYEHLNEGSPREVTLPISYFTWNYYGSRHDLFPNIAEFATTGYVSQWNFVTFEVTAEKQVGGQTINETRYYVSYPYELFMSGRESIYEKKHLDEYFTKTVVEPAAQRGVKITYYDSSIEISNYKTFAEAWEKRAEQVDTIKRNQYPQYDFLVINSGPNKGEATSFPFCAANCTGERARVTSTEARPATTKH